MATSAFGIFTEFHMHYEIYNEITSLIMKLMGCPFLPAVSKRKIFFSQLPALFLHVADETEYKNQLLHKAISCSLLAAQSSAMAVSFVGIMGVIMH